jgi:rod shape-determining protein MreB and related proteins
MKFFDSFFKDVGIDLGTANTLIYLKYKGLVINEPSVAAINTKTNAIVAVGDEAKKMLGRTPAHLAVIRPLVNGVISDFDMTREMLEQFLKRVSKDKMSFASFRRAIIAIPNNLTEVERKSVEDAAIHAGCAKVYLVEEPIAAALGADLPIETPLASLVVDIGGGTTDIAVISLDGAVISRTVKIAGDRFNEEIVRFVRDEFKLMIGEQTAEMAKIAVGSAIPMDEKMEVAIRGRDVTNGLPKEVMIKNIHIRAALNKSIRVIVDAILETIEATPPELVGDMLKQGISLCGGGALLRGLDELIEKETSVEVHVAQDPLTAVVRGLGKIVDDFDRYRPLLDNPLKPPVITL